jgi:hypothetical protein
VPGLQLLRTLLENGASPNDHGTDYYWSTALGVAAATNNVDAAKILLQYGAVLNAQSQSTGMGCTSFECTATQDAAKNLHLEVLKILIQNQTNSEITQRALLEALDEMTCSNENNPDVVLKIVQLLVDKQIKLNDQLLAKRFYDGLIKVLSDGYESNLRYSLVKMFIESGAFLTAQDSNEWTPLHYMTDNISMYDKPVCRNTSDTSKAFYELLQTAGVDHKVKDINGKTARELINSWDTSRLKIFDQIFGLH